MSPLNYDIVSHFLLPPVRLSTTLPQCRLPLRIETLSFTIFYRVHRPQWFTYILMNASFCFRAFQVFCRLSVLFGIRVVFFFYLSKSRRTFELSYSTRFKTNNHVARRSTGYCFRRPPLNIALSNNFESITHRVRICGQRIVRKLMFCDNSAISIGIIGFY